MANMKDKITVNFYSDDGLYMTLDYSIMTGIFTPNEVREIVNESDYRISIDEASEAFFKLAETVSINDYDFGISNKDIHKKRELTIDEQIEAQWGNRPSIWKRIMNKIRRIDYDH